MKKMGVFALIVLFICLGFTDLAAARGNDSHNGGGRSGVGGGRGGFSRGGAPGGHNIDGGKQHYGHPSNVRGGTISRPPVGGGPLGGARFNGPARGPINGPTRVGVPPMGRGPVVVSRPGYRGPGFFAGVIVGGLIVSSFYRPYFFMPAPYGFYDPYWNYPYPPPPYVIVVPPPEFPPPDYYGYTDPKLDPSIFPPSTPPPPTAQNIPADSICYMPKMDQAGNIVFDKDNNPMPDLTKPPVPCPKQ